MSPVHYRWIIFALMGAAYFVVYIQRMGLAVIATDLMEQVSLSPAQMGLLGSAFLYGYAVTMLVSGVLAAKFGPRRLVTVFFLLAAGGVMLFASIDGFNQAFIGRLLSGVGVAAVLTSAITLFSRWFSTKEYPKVMAGYFALGGLGSLMATTPLSVMNSQFGWRDTFWTVGVVTCVIAVALWLVVRDYPPRTESAQKDGAQEESISIFAALKTLFAMRNFWCLIAWHGSMAASFYAFAGLWGGVYLEEVFALDRVTIGNLLGMGAIGFILGGPILAWLCGHGLRSHKLVPAGAGVLGIMGIAPLVFFTGELSVPMLYVLTLMLGFAANAPNAINFTIARISFGAKLAGPSGGFIGASTFFAGATMQAIMGNILSAYGDAGRAEAFSAAFLVLLIAAVIATVSGLLLHETYGRE